MSAIITILMVSFVGFVFLIAAILDYSAKKGNEIIRHKEQFRREKSKLIEELEKLRAQQRK